MKIDNNFCKKTIVYVSMFVGIIGGSQILELLFSQEVVAIWVVVWGLLSIVFFIDLLETHNKGIYVGALLARMLVFICYSVNNAWNYADTDAFYKLAYNYYLGEKNQTKTFYDGFFYQLFLRFLGVISQFQFSLTY